MERTTEPNANQWVAMITSLNQEKLICCFVTLGDLARSQKSDPRKDFSKSAVEFRFRGELHQEPEYGGPEQASREVPSSSSHAGA
jgi:hypothetical protein